MILTDEISSNAWESREPAMKRSFHFTSLSANNIYYMIQSIIVVVSNFVVAVKYISLIILYYCIGLRFFSVLPWDEDELH